MRKGLISSGVLIAAFFLLIIMALYGDRGPEGRHPFSAIPEPANGALFLYFEGKNTEEFLPLSRTAAKIGGRRTRAFKALSVLSPLFESAGETAALLTWEGNSVHFFMSAKLQQETTHALAEGRFPREAAGKLRDISLHETSPGLFVVQRNGMPLPLHFGVRGGISLFASSQEKVERMIVALEKQTHSIDNFRKIEQRWPNHILFSDGGLLSGVASMEGLPATKGNLIISAAWRKEASEGRMEWRIEGLSEIFPPSFVEGLRSVRLDDGHSFPEPLVAAAGFNIPDGISAFFDHERFGNLREHWDNGDKLFREVLPGPCILSLCGSSKFLVFSLPGILLGLPERGWRGEAFVDRFWKREWSALVPGIEKIDAFPMGGTTAIPFSILAAANFRILQLGLIDRDALRHERFRPLREYAPTLENRENVFFWAYLDIPKIASALQNLAKTGRMAEKMGKNLRMSPNALFQAAKALEGLGTLTVVMPVPGEGFLEWRATGERAGDEPEQDDLVLTSQDSF